MPGKPVNTDSTMKNAHAPIYIPADHPDQWQTLLADPGHWRTGYSAKALAYCWHEAKGDFPPEVRQVLTGSGIDVLQSLEMLLGIPEFAVPIPGGSRRSYTDLLVLAGNHYGLAAMAVAGKAQEGFGRSIGQGQGNRERLSYLLNALELTLHDQEAETIPYQLLHRTYSAVHAARQFKAHVALMVVHQFGERKGFEDFAAFARWCAKYPQDRYEANQVIHAGPIGGIQLYLAWVDGDESFLHR